MIAVMQAGPHSDIEIEPGRAPMPVREFDSISARKANKREQRRYG
jgi:hypothetical protein